MPIIAAALPAVIAAGATIGASALAAGSQKKAINKATEAATESNAEALALQEKQNAQQRADYAPWRAVGVSALQMLSRTMGIKLPDNVFTNSIADVSGYTPPASPTPVSTGGATPTTEPAPTPANTAPAETLISGGKTAGQSYFDSNPDVKAEWDRIVSTGNAGNDKFKNDPDKYAAWHYQTYGAGEGRGAPTATAPVYQAPTTSPPTTTPATNTPGGNTTGGTAPPVTTNTGQPVSGNGLSLTPSTSIAANTGRYGDFYASPDYQFRLDEGTRNITGNAAAKGLLDSGALGKGLINYGQQAASQEFGSWFDRIATLAGYGSSAVAGTTAAGQAAANNQSGIIQDTGQTMASSIATKGGINSGLINSAGSAIGGLISNIGGGSGGVTAAGTPATSNAGIQWQTPFNSQGLVPTGSNLYGAVI